MYSILILLIGIPTGIASFLFYFIETNKGRTKKEEAKTEDEATEIDESPPSIHYEIIVPKGRGDVIIRSGRIRKHQMLLLWRGSKPLPRAYFVNHIIKRQVVKKTLFGLKQASEYVVRFNVSWMEALKEGQIIPDPSTELSNLAFSNDMVQMRDAISAISSFVLDERMIKLMLVFFVFAIPFGFVMNSILNLIPVQVVHWIP